MKKALVIFLALSLVTSVFAVEPVAKLDLVDFTGWASVGFGVNLDDGKTGFENETGVTLNLNFLTESDKSTTGSGIWGELIVLLDGDMLLEIDDAPSGATAGLEFAELIIDEAKLHVYDFYVGFKQGEFDYGGDFLFPNALNYDSDDSPTIVTIDGSTLGVNLMDESLSGFSSYDNGIVVGYANDFFSLEANVNTKSRTNLDEASIVSIVQVTAALAGNTNGTNLTSDPIVLGEAVTLPAIASNQRYVADVLTGGTTTGAGAVVLDNRPEQPDGQYVAWGLVYLITYDSDDTNFYTNDYAIGVYAEVKPVTDLVFAVGFATILSDSVPSDTEAPGIYTNQDTNSGLFLGASYILPITEMYTLQPVVAYRREATIANFFDDGPHAHLGMGLRFGWGEEVEETSLLVDFFEDDIVYETDDDDEKLLPGISVFTSLHFEYDDLMHHYLPIMVTAYSGEIVPNFKLYGLFFMNIAASDGETATPIDEDSMNKVLDSGGGLQAGLAGSYDIAVGDGVTVTPKLGFLLGAVNFTRTGAVLTDEHKTGEAIYVRPEAVIEVTGLVSNTTFTLAWEEANFIKYKLDDAKSSKNTNGELKFTTKIAL